MSSGKINFDGANSELEVLEMFHWLNLIFTKYWDEIIYDPEKDRVCISDDSEYYESLYDSE